MSTCAAGCRCRSRRPMAAAVAGGALCVGYALAAVLGSAPATAAEDDAMAATAPAGDAPEVVTEVEADSDLTWTADLSTAIEITPLRDQPDQIEKASHLATEPTVETTAATDLLATAAADATVLESLDADTALGSDSPAVTKDGFTLVYTSEGVTGYVRSEDLRDYQAPAAVEVSDVTAADGADVPAPVAGDLVSIAASRIGSAYGYGSNGPNAFDCSGLVSWTYAQKGISMPRSSGAILNAGTVIPASEAQPGDIIWSPGHVAIYAGGNSQIEAVGPGQGVQQTTLWQDNPVFVRY